ncbi:MAG: DUF4294 domain-containing protein [Bacteroidaceae bacterium]|nr:DUF4294 domain-containing protein [Prevotellaceae bacterium]MDY5632295.1 DUF4294 domain-containing protein [Bacteroidaceae bacterium]
MRTRIPFTLSLLLLPFCQSLAQDFSRDPETGQPFVSARNQTWYYVGRDYVYEGDTIWTVLMPEMPVYAPLRFKSKKEAQRYNRLVYNVKRVLPLAQEANRIIRETYLVLEKLPTKKEKDAHIKLLEKELKERYTPEMKKLTYSQGKLLIKLVDRECHQSGFEVVKAFLGPARATFYQVFAWTFNASLKKEYDAEGDDRLIERIVVQVEAGLL